MERGRDGLRLRVPKRPGAHRAVAVAAALLVPLGWADGVRAGTYRVLACDAAPGGANNSWREREHRGMSAEVRCPSRGDRRRGLVVRNRVNVGTVRHRKGAFMTFAAPAGAALHGIELEWGGRRVGGDWLLGLVRGGGRLVAGCRPAPGSGRAVCRLGAPKRSPRVRRRLGGARSVRIEASCGLRRGCNTAALRRGADRTRARLAVHRVAVRVRDGSAPNLRVGGGLLDGGWQRGRRSASVAGRDNVGVRSTSLRVDGVTREAEPERCDFTRPVPCPRAVRGDFRLDTRDIPDGRHRLALTAADAARNARSAERVVRIDNHAPDRVRAVRILGGDRVRAANSFDLRWSPPGGQVAPIAHARYRLCEEGARKRCVKGSRPGATRGMDDLSVPSRGSWRFRVWLEDAAGNADPATASAPVTLRFDDRTPARLRAGIATRRGPARRATVAFGTRPEVRGRLAGADGERLRNASLLVLTRTRGSEHFRRVGRTATGAGGRFHHRLPAGPSRTVRVDYPGSPRHRPTAARARLAVRAKSSIRVSRHRVENGDRVRFRGRLLGGAVPRTGKLLQLEAFYRSRWRTFAVVRSSARGRWRYVYRFEATRGRVRYPFRVWVPREPGYPYAPGRSRVVRVTVNGR